MKLKKRKENLDDVTLTISMQTRYYISGNELNHIPANVPLKKNESQGYLEIDHFPSKIHTLKSFAPILKAALIHPELVHGNIFENYKNTTNLFVKLYFKYLNVKNESTLLVN